MNYIYFSKSFKHELGENPTYMELENKKRGMKYAYHVIRYFNSYTGKEDIIISFAYDYKGNRNGWTPASDIPFDVMEKIMLDFQKFKESIDFETYDERWILFP